MVQCSLEWPCTAVCPLLVLPGTVPYCTGIRNTEKTAVGVKHACKRRSGTTYRLHAQQIFQHGRGARSELLMNSCVCVCVCVCLCVRCSTFKKLIQLVSVPVNQRELIWNTFKRLLPSPSQDREPEVSGPYEITEKWPRTQVANPCINTLPRTDMHIERTLYR